MKKLISLLFLITSFITNGQEASLDKVLRINILNPGVEFELPVSTKGIISLNPGIGMNSSYVSSRSPIGDSGLTYFISPFADVSYKNIYNREARHWKSKNTSYNSGNFWGIRLLTKFGETGDAVSDREDNIDFSLSPVWGIQRAYGKFHLLFNTGPVYFFDMKGNHYFFPVTMELNIGFNMKSW